MMRRGHPGIGGWRNENPRHFRPRGGIPPHFRPPRNYPPLDVVRFPPPGIRPHRGPRPYNIHTMPVTDGHIRPEHHERNKYRFINPQSNQLRHQDRSHKQDHRHHYMSAQRTRHNDVSDHSNTYKDTSNYYENTNQNEQYCVNNMGDVDHRQYFNLNQNQESDKGFKQHQTPNWSKSPSDTKKTNFDDRSYPNKNYRHDSSEQNKIPVLDYTGHRPPASDHYGGNPNPAMDNSNTFSRSVDDTVNLIRKRLLNRNESQHLSEEHSNEQSHNEKKDANETTSNKYQNVQQEQPIKRRLQRQKQSVNSNCDKMKNKIVHQLFKMDKDKIHKLMDNPNSSTKFEYAINSLITESRNSFNRHLRSVAEKSLCSSSSEFIHNDNNTIYEDTFMKEMQCILDPQDTVLLEDIKPIVMAELTKVLQLDDVEQIYELVDESTACHSRDEQTNYPQYANESYDYNDYTQSNTYYPDSKHDVYQSSTMSERIENSTTSDEINRDYEYDPKVEYGESKVEYGESKPLFKRRPTRKSSDYSQDTRSSTESQRQSVNSVENKLNEEVFNNNDSTIPFFESNAEQLSEEEDPFAELDNQYHVAVDPNFIETDDISTPRQTNPNNKSAPVNEVNCNLQSPDENLYNIKNEIDSQLQSIAKTPLKLCSIINNKNKEELEHKSLKLLDVQVKQEVTQSFDHSQDNLPNITPSANNVVVTMDNDNIMQEYNIESEEKEVKICENSNITEKSSIPSNARKRSIDQRPSHRKEKRKKSESNQIETNKQILNKNVIINVNDCAAKASENCDAPKSIFNLHFSKNATDKDTTNENKKTCTTDKQYSDKYVKRKESQKRPKEKESDTKRKNSNNDTSSHSILSPNNNSNTSTGSQTLNKTEAKKKLQTIDMFVEQPRKVNIHQAHRNTALTPNVINKNLEDKKIKPGINTNSRLNKKHIATQVVKKTMSKETQTFESKSSTTRFCQTEIKTFSVKAVQTDLIFFEKSGSKSIDTFERMKEIDMEIQMLLQEKFKLYNSLESKDSCPNTMQTLGMTVLNVAPFEETRENEVSTETVLSEDVIGEDFTSIPAEELEQIAFESMEEVPNEPPKVETRSRRQKIIEKDRKSSESPKPSAKKVPKKTKTPNISLIEQIITDDRPLEDIISLDDLEVSPIKTRRTQRLQNKPKRKVIKKMKQMKPLYSNVNFEIKECSVVVVREDFSKLFRAKSEEPIVIEEPVPEQEENIVVEPLINDIQFDMLDVSEDIIIDDNCEVKSLSDKDVIERIDMPVSEEIILDNSQSSADEVIGTDVSRDIVCKMYDYTTDEYLKRDSVAITGHGDAVLAIECIENNFIVACLDGNVYYFSGDGQLITTLRGSNLAVTCLTIVKEKYGTTVYTGSLDSRIRYFDLETGLEKGPECNVLSPIQSMDRAWDTVFVGTRTGFVLQFECKNNMLIPVSTVKFSEQSILALRAMKEGPRKVLLVAARSDNVTIKDAQTGLLLRTLVGPKMTVYSLLYEDGKVYCGTSSHQIHVFDYTSGTHVGTHEGGKGAVCLRATGGVLFAGCYDGCVYVYREGESRPFAQLRGPGPMLLSLVIVGSKIIAGYKDRSLYIWKIPLSILKEMIL